MKFQFFVGLLLAAALLGGEQHSFVLAVSSTFLSSLNIKSKYQIAAEQRKSKAEAQVKMEKQRKEAARAKAKESSIFGKNLLDPTDVALGRVEMPPKPTGPTVVVQQEQPECPPKPKPENKKLIEAEALKTVQGEKAMEKEEQEQELAAESMERKQKKKEKATTVKNRLMRDEIRRLQNEKAHNVQFQANLDIYRQVKEEQIAVNNQLNSAISLLTKPSMANTSSEDVIAKLHDRLQASRNNGKLIKEGGKMKVVTASGLLPVDEEKVKAKMFNRCEREYQKMKNPGKTEVEED